MFETVRTEVGRLRSRIEGLTDRVRRSRPADAATAAELEDLLAAVGSLRRATDGLLVEVTGRLRLQRTTRQVAEDLARATGTTPGAAQEFVAVAERLQEIGRAREALAAGRLSVTEARVIAEAAPDRDTEHRLVRVAEIEGLGVLRREATAARAATEDPAARRQRHRAARGLSTWTDLDGMVAGRFRLPPEVGGEVRAILDDATRRRYRAQPPGRREPPERCAADALVALLRSAARRPVPGGRSGRSGRTGRSDPARRPGTVRPVLHVVVDHAALMRGATLPGERCEIPGVGQVSVDWARQLLGEAFLTAVIASGRDVRTVAHLGRHVPAEVRTALIAQGRRCDVEGCARAGYLELDHCEVDHAAGGPTSLDNLTWLCWQHHRRKTDGARLGPRNPVTGKRPLGPPADSGAPGSGAPGRRRRTHDPPRAA
jgi:hypothetical protein